MCSTKTSLREAFLIIGTSTANKDRYFVFNQSSVMLCESFDDAFESIGHIGEIGDTSTNDQHPFIKQDQTTSS